MSKRGREESLVAFFVQVQARAGLEFRPALGLHTLFAGGRLTHAAQGATVGEHAANECAVAHGTVRANARRCYDAVADCLGISLVLLCAHHGLLN